ncbi:hypothetical protein C8C83_5391 [Flavobacterium sp. 90]|uniref:hypothetical protein n=1 Tax=unclassified Flavobacterium TaxID=196869 RepID=UPI000F0E2DF1|nr:MULTISPECIES: hypothetical protein [unclassified Flavobacterium]RKR08156.1 hypothetical protein C8C82_0018 [Flavobacterium sp. 81]TCK57347.1 hypothetical protein C8C83_5391 [Flavobacterium sp. 90]
MLSNISWGDYAVTVLVVVLFWYIVVILKFYLDPLKELLKGNTKLKFFKTPKAPAVDQLKDLFAEFKEPFDTLQDARELFSKLEKAISEAVQNNFSGIEFKNYVKFILEEYPYVRKSTLREKINALMVSECEKHPQLILTYPEMDGLWDETIS